MTLAAEDIARALEGYFSSGDLAGRLAARGARVAAGVASQAEPGAEDGPERLDLTNTLPRRGPWDRVDLIVPARFEKEAELFYGPFMQLGTYLGVENDALRFLVDVVADPTNLVLPGSGVLLNKVGKIGRLMSSAVQATKAGAGRAKTIAEAFDGIESVIKLAGGGDDYLKALNAAARKGLGQGKQFKALIDAGLKAENLTPEATQLLQVLRKNRGAFTAISDLAGKVGQARLDRAISLGGRDVSLMLQPTLRGRLLAGQVNPLFRIEEPFALTRSLLGLSKGDLTLWTPVTERFVLGSNADAILGPLGKNSLTAQVSRGTPDEYVIGAVSEGLMNPVARERVLDFHLAANFLAAATGDPVPQYARHLAGMDLPDDFVRQVGADALGRKVADEELDAIRSDLTRIFVDQAQADDTYAAQVAGRQMSARFDEIKKLSREKAGEQAASGRLLAEQQADFVKSYTKALKDIYDTRDVSRLAQDPSGYAGAVETLDGLASVYMNTLVNRADDVIRSAIGGKRASTLHGYMREALAFPIEYPELFVRTQDGVLRLADEATVAQAVAEGAAEGGFGFWSDFLRRTKADGLDIQTMLRDTGFGPDITEVIDGLRGLNQSQLDAMLREGVLGKGMEDYFRRHVTLKNVDAVTAEKLVQTYREEAAGDTPLGRALRSALSGRGTVKGTESVQKARRATEKLLLDLEAAGKLRVERDSLVRFVRGHEASTRAMRAKSFWDQLAILDEKVHDFYGWKPQVITREVAEQLNQSADIPFLPKADRPQIPLDKIPARGIPQVVADHPLTGARAHEAAGLDEATFRTIYAPLDLAQDQWDATPMARLHARALEGARRSGLGSPVIRERVRSQVRDRLKSARRTSLVRKVFGSAQPRYAPAKTGLKGRPIPDAVVDEILLGGNVPGGVFKAGDVRKRRDAFLKAEGEAAAVAMDEAAEKVLASGRTGVEEGKRRIWVAKPLVGQLKNTLNLWDRASVGPNGAIASWYHRLNYGLKGLLLNLSPFHYNVLGAAHIIANPEKAMRIMMHPLAKEFRKGLYVKQGLFTGLGAAMGAGLSGGDEEDMIAGGLAGLIFGTAIGAAIAGAKTAHKYALEPEFVGTLARMGRAGWSGRPDDRSIGFMARFFKEQSDAIKRTVGEPTIRARFLDGAYEVQTAFERSMWEISHNHFKMLAFHNWAAKSDERVVKQLLAEGFVEGTVRYRSELERRQLIADRETWQVVNSGFGGHSTARLWNDPRWHQAVQGFMFLSPDWTVGNLMGAGNILLNMNLATSSVAGAGMGLLAELVSVGWDADKLTGMGVLGGAAVGPMIRTMATRSMSRMLLPGDTARQISLRFYRNALLGGYAFSNIMNWINTGGPDGGRYMWDNPEGRRLSIAMPGGDYYVTLGKPYTEAFEFMAATEGEKYPLPLVSRFASKIPPLPSLAFRLLSNGSAYGPMAHLSDEPGELLYRTGTTVLSSLAPISVQAPARAIAGGISGREKDPLAALTASLVSAGGFAVGRERNAAPDLARSLAVLGISPPPSGAPTPILARTIQ